MLNEYIQAAMRQAQYCKLEDDGTFFAEIPGFQGVYANNANWEDCRNELKEVLEEWLLFKLQNGDMVPTIEGMDLKFKKAEAEKEDDENNQD